MVESDYLGEEGSNLYPDPADPRQWTRLGRSWPLADWSEGEGGMPFLTALGPGDDPGFAASVANVDDVLSFWDGLEDPEIYLPEEERDLPVELSYQVLGWFAGAREDPLQKWQTLEQWRGKMAAAGWSVGDEHDLFRAVEDATGEPPNAGDPRSSYPTRTLCHGMVFGVRWTGRFLGRAQPFTRGADSPFRETPIESRSGWRNPGYGEGEHGGAQWPDQPEPSRTDFPHLAIGNSEVDALASLVEYLLGEEDRVDVSTLVQALDYDLLDRYDERGGQLELAQRIHQEWFRSLPGGTSWELAVPRSDEDPGGPPPAEDPRPGADPVALLEDQGRLDLLVRLEELNGVQRQLDEGERALDSRRRRLYALWWKDQRLPFLAAEEVVDLDPRELSEAVTEASGQVRSQLAVVADLRAGRDEQLAELRREVAALERPLEVLERPAPRLLQTGRSGGPGLRRQAFHQAWRRWPMVGRRHPLLPLQRPGAGLPRGRCRRRRGGSGA